MVIDPNFYFILIVILTALQSVIGVGVLVLGTPIFLIFGYSFYNTLLILLPISILTSLINIIIYRKKKFFVISNFLKKDENVLFYYYCIPSIFFGLILLKLFSSYINFKILISLMLLISLVCKHYLQNIFPFIKKKFLNLFYILTGIVHGLTNSGGSLILLLVSYNKKNFKKDGILLITFFYLILVSIQFLLFILIFWNYIDFFILKNFLLPLIFGILIGNIFIKKISENFLKKLVDILVFFSSISLLLDSLKVFSVINKLIL